jgi:hypothetical protein
LEKHGGLITSLVELKEHLRLQSRAARKSFRLDVDELVAAYHVQRDCSPRRSQGYLSASRIGVTSSGGASNRAEEHLAVGLFLRGELSLPNGEALTLLDYQFPLKSVRADAGIGKIDLLGLHKDGTLAVVELKVAGNREDRRIALVEGLIYAAVIEANIEQIAAEILAARNVRILKIRPKVIVIGPRGYWFDRRISPSIDDFNALTRAVACAVPLEISSFCLNDADLVAFGLNGRPPQVHGHGFLSLVEGDRSQPAPMHHVSQTAYREDLHRRLWNYRRTSFPGASDLFDPSHSEGRSPPVFRREFAGLNLLLPSTADSGISAAITAMIPHAERHRWFASMSSSQALAQSVFASLATLGRLAALENITSREGYPAFFDNAESYQLKLEHQVATLGEPRRTSLDVFLTGPRKVAVEVKFTEGEFGRCSRPRMRPEEANFARDHCDGSFSVQRDRQSRCSLSERGILYWQFVPQFFTWTATEDHHPCPLAFTYQLVRNVLAVCVGEDGVPTADGGHVLVIYDERNPAFQPGGEADAAWWAAIRALRFPRLLRRVSWQSIASHLARFPELAWLAVGLEEKYGLK